MVDVASGAVRRVKQSVRTPRGLGLSPDGRFLALMRHVTRTSTGHATSSYSKWRHGVSGASSKAPAIVGPPSGRRAVIGCSIWTWNNRRSALAAARVRDGRLAATPWRLHDDLGAVGSMGASGGGIWYGRQEAHLMCSWSN